MTKGKKSNLIVDPYYHKKMKHKGIWFSCMECYDHELELTRETND